MQGKHFAANLLAVFRPRRIQTAMKTDDTGDIGAAARQLEHCRSAKTISNGGHLRPVRQLLLPRRFQRSVGTTAQQFAVAFVFAGLFRGVLRRRGPNTAAIHVSAKSHIAHFRQLPRACFS